MWFQKPASNYLDKKPNEWEDKFVNGRDVNVKQEM